MVGPMVKWKTFTMLPEVPRVKSGMDREADFSHVTNLVLTGCYGSAEYFGLTGLPVAHCGRA